MIALALGLAGLLVAGLCRNEPAAPSDPGRRSLTRVNPAAIQGNHR